MSKRKGFVKAWALLAIIGLSPNAWGYGTTQSIGGLGEDLPTSIALDVLDNQYMAGSFSATVDFDPSVAGVSNILSAGLSDAFLTKRSPVGAVLWTKRLGGAGVDVANHVFVSPLLSLVTGSFSGTVTFDPLVGTQFVSGGATDAFLQTYLHDGTYKNTFVVGGTGAAVGTASVEDANGNLYFYGHYSGSVNLNPVGTDPLTLVTSSGLNDFFLVKYDIKGAFVWGKTWGGLGDSIAKSMSIDLVGNLYLGAEFSGTVDFDAGLGVVSHVANGLQDIAITRINADGTHGWTKTIGGTGIDLLGDVAADDLAAIYYTGMFSASVDMDPSIIGVDTRVSLGLGDSFVTKLNPDGTYAWSKTWGGFQDDQGKAVLTNAAGEIYVAHEFQGVVDIDPSFLAIPTFVGEGIDNRTSNGLRDFSLTKFLGDGTFLFSYTLGGTLSDTVNSISIDSVGNVHMPVAFGGTVDFDPTVGVDPLTSNGLNDMALISFDFVAPVLAETKAVPSPNPSNTPNVTISSSEAGVLSMGGGCITLSTAVIAGDNIIAMNILADGLYAGCFVTVTDAGGNVSTALPLSPFAVDLVAPNKPVITAPATNTLSHVVSSPLIVGTSEPYAMITVLDNGSLIGMTTASALGAWSVPSTAVFTDGNHQIVATATDGAGNVSVVSDSVNYNVNTAVLPTAGCMTTDIDLSYLIIFLNLILIAMVARRSPSGRKHSHSSEEGSNLVVAKGKCCKSKDSKSAESGSRAS